MRVKFSLKYIQFTFVIQILVEGLIQVTCINSCGNSSSFDYLDNTRTESNAD